MSATHLHLMLNRLPSWAPRWSSPSCSRGLFRRSRDVQRTALGAAVIVAALSYPVFLGEPAEERVEDAAWMQERMVHEHEERAEAALIAIMITGAVALVTLWQSRGDRPVTHRPHRPHRRRAPGQRRALRLGGARRRRDPARRDPRRHGAGPAGRRATSRRPGGGWRRRRWRRRLRTSRIWRTPRGRRAPPGGKPRPRPP